MQKRQLPSFTDGFYKYTDKIGSPNLFRKWAGIFAVAGALERKVWIRTNKGVLYPNLYAVMVGPPGAGKTLATAIAHEMLVKLEDHHIAPTSVTKASLMDALSQAERRIIRPQDVPSIISFNSLTIMSDELGVLIPSYENDFMNVLTNIYDCRVYSETRRTSKINIKMDAPQLNLIAATTPSYLNNLLPDGAWDQGFLSRTMLIYSGASLPGNLFLEAEQDKDLHKRLTSDLKSIGDLYGPMTFEKDAADIFVQWHMTGIHGGPPIPDHPKLVHYNTRRSAHLLKLCMVSSASCGNDRVITLDNYTEALDWLVEAESFIPDIFKSMNTGGDGRVIDDCWHHVYTLWMKEQKPIAEHRIVAFLNERTPAHNVGRIIEVMERAKLLEQSFEPHIGKCYKPMARRAA